MSEITFKISKETGDLNFSSITCIDEEGLLPGTEEPRETSGILTLSSNVSDLKFAPLSDQHALHALQLKNDTHNLHYTLSADNQQLNATAGIDGPIIFSLHLEKNGAYTFTLHNHIDRDGAKNLVQNSDLFIQETNEGAANHIGLHEMPGWQTQTSTENDLSITQNIPTLPGAPYQLTFYYEPQNISQNKFEKLHLYWGDQLLHTINTQQENAKAYSFSLEGNSNHDTTALQIIGIGGDDFIGNYLNHISICSTTQNQLHIPFEFIALENETISNGQFTVNVTNTPPIELSNQFPFELFYEQAVYQTIIVNDENHHHNPLATINLESLFTNLAISSENRVVEVIQREENGSATNVYEVRISDKSVELAPITVADVQLSFPGGDGGLSVFHKNIIIDNGEGNDGSVPLPPQDHFS